MIQYNRHYRVKPHLNILITILKSKPSDPHENIYFVKAIRNAVSLTYGVRCLSSQQTNQISQWLQVLEIKRLWSCNPALIHIPWGNQWWTRFEGQNAPLIKQKVYFLTSWTAAMGATLPVLITASAVLGDTDEHLDAPRMKAVILISQVWANNLYDNT